MSPMSRKRIDLSALRSQRWFGAPGQPGNHKSYRTKQMGFTSEDFQGKPVIGIFSTWSDLNSCHTHFPAARSRRSSAACGRPADFRS